MSERSFRRQQERRVAAARRRDEVRSRRRRAGLTAVAAGAFALANAAPASAVPMNFEVNDLGDGAADACDLAECTLRDAINAAALNPDNDTITFAAGLSGEITLTDGPLVFGDTYNLSITGPAPPDEIIVSGDNNDRVLDVLDPGGIGSRLTITGLELTEGYGDIAGGVYIEDDARLTLNDSLVTYNEATGGNVPSGATYELPAAGGGILNLGELTINDSELSDNYSDASLDPGDFEFVGGGAIANAGELEVSDSLITGNGAVGAGGAIFQPLSYKYNAEMEIRDSGIYGNYSDAGGGAIGSMNTAKYGSSHNVIADSTIAGNESGTYGGGINFLLVGATVDWNITHSSIVENYAGNIGGGMSTYGVSGHVGVVDSTISGNEASFGGGGVYAGPLKYEDSLKFGNSTIADNYAGGYGGGIALQCGCGSDDYFNMQLDSTIVGDNTVFDGPNDIDQDGPDGGFDLSFSLVESPAGSAVIEQTPPGSSILGVDPQLGPLDDNGGPTPTHLPAITSPVVDKGNSPVRLLTDQRGDPRRVDTLVPNASDGTDIGSVELAQGPPAAAPTISTAGVTAKKKRNRVVRTKRDSTRVRVRFTSSTSGAAFQCKVDNGDFETCTSPFRARVSSKAGKGAKHKITIRALNAAGQPVGETAVVNFRVIKV